MGDTVNLYDAKTNLSKLVDRAAAGEEIVIAKGWQAKGQAGAVRGAAKTAYRWAKLPRDHLHGRRLGRAAAARNPTLFRRRKSDDGYLV